MHLGNEVEVLPAVDVEVGGAVERHEEVGDVGDALDPGRPRALVVHGEAEQLVDVGDPLHRVAHDEDEHDRQRDLGNGKRGIGRVYRAPLEKPSQVASALPPVCDLFAPATHP